MKKRSFVQLLTIAVAFLFTLPLLHSQTTTVWDGEGADNLWSTGGSGGSGGNWTNADAPVSGDTLQFGAGNTDTDWLQRTNVNDIDDLSVERIVINGGDWNFSGKKITFTATDGYAITQGRARTKNKGPTKFSMDMHFADGAVAAIREDSNVNADHLIELAGKITGNVDLTYNPAISTATLLLSNNENAFTGNLIYSTGRGGTIAVTSVANKGETSAMGAGSQISVIGGSAVKATFSYRGTTHGSTDRDISLTNLRSDNIISFSNDSPNNSNLAFTGTITALTRSSAAATPTLQFTGTSTGVSTFAPVIYNPTNDANAFTNVTVNTSGTWVFTGDHTYTGITTVEGGTMMLSGGGSIALSSKLSVDSGATFSVASITDDSYTFGVSQTVAGEGLITSGGKDLLLNGILTPGTETDAGVLTFALDAGTLSLGESADLQFRLGTSSDLAILSSGTLDIGTGLEFNNFTFTAVEGFGKGEYTLFSTTESIMGSLGALKTGLIDGYSAELKISGNNLILDVIPEPSTLLLTGLAGMGIIALIFRHRCP